MSLQVVGSVNKLSEELLKTVPTLKAGQIRRFRRLDGIYDPHKKVYNFGSGKKITMHDHIIDPHTGSVVEIGVFKSGAVVDNRVNPGGWSRYQYNKTTKGDGALLEYISFSGSQIEDVKAFPYFFLSNANAANPNRDQSIPVIYTYVDEEKEAKSLQRSFDDTYKAMHTANSMTIDEIRMFAAAKGWPLADPALQAKVKAYAQSNPVEFLREMGDQDNVKLKSNIKLAIDEAIIVYDPVGHRILNKEGTQIALLERDESKDYLQLFADWVTTSGDGKKVMAGINKKTKYVLSRKAKGEEEADKEEEEETD